MDGKITRLSQIKDKKTQFFAYPIGHQMSFGLILSRAVMVITKDRYKLFSDIILFKTGFDARYQFCGVCLVSFGLSHEICIFLLICTSESLQSKFAYLLEFSVVVCLAYIIKSVPTQHYLLLLVVGSDLLSPAD